MGLCRHCLCVSVGGFVRGRRNADHVDDRNIPIIISNYSMDVFCGHRSWRARLRFNLVFFSLQFNFHNSSRTKLALHNRSPHNAAHTHTPPCNYCFGVFCQRLCIVRYLPFSLIWLPLHYTTSPVPWFVVE